MKTKILLTAMLLCSVFFAHGQWTYTNLSFPTCQLSATSLGNKAYFAGGIYESSGNYYYNSKVEIYDVTNGTWATPLNLSFARQFPAAVSSGSKVFFAGGIRIPNVYSMVDIYDVFTQQWTVSSLSEPRFAAAAVAVGNKVLFAGGADLASNSVSAVVDIYDMQTGQWLTPQYLVEARTTGGVVVGNKAYFVGGFDLTFPVEVMDVYDATTNEWTWTTIPEARIFSGIVAAGNKILVAGGMTDPEDSLSASNRVDIYDVNTGNWTIQYLYTARAIGAAVVNGSKVFFIGGGKFLGSEASWVSSSDVIDIYDVTTGEWTMEQMTVERINLAAASAGNYVLIAGGLSLNPDVLHSSVEIYNTTASTNIIHVPGDYPTIQAGIDAASPGDTVLVADGLYYENINFLGKKPLVVASNFIMNGDTNHIANTIINGSQPVNPDIGSVITFELGEDTTSVVCGFTITGGIGTIEPSVNYRMGGGVHIKYSGGKLTNNYIQDNNVSYDWDVYGGGLQTGGPISEIPWIVLRGNRIQNNHAISDNGYSSGGGIICFYNLIMSDNQIYNNSAYGYLGGSGGGVEIAGAFGLIEINVSNNFIYENLASTDYGTSAYDALGGGICLHHNITGKIADNSIFSNSLLAPGFHWSWGPGVFIQDITSNGFKFENNVVAENYGNTQMCRGGGISLLRSGGNYYNNVIQNNTASHGGGIAITDAIEVNDTAVFINNTVTLNSGTDGGGVFLEASNAVVMNTIIWGNTATNSPAIYETGSNLQVRYSNVQGTTVWPGEGNMNATPLFLPDGYHLDFSCLLVNAGIETITISGQVYNCPAYDIDGEPRPYGSTQPEIGADEVPFAISVKQPMPVNGFQFAVFPNPARDHITLSVNPGTVIHEAAIFNQMGQRVYNSAPAGGMIHLPDLLPGVYVIEIQTNYGQARQKFIVK